MLYINLVNNCVLYKHILIHNVYIKCKYTIYILKYLRIYGLCKVYGDERCTLCNTPLENKCFCSCLLNNILY